MGWTFVTDPPSAVEFIMAVSATIMGLSHIARHGMWTQFFGWLHQKGEAGVVLRTFALELWPALIIVGLHQVWSGPGILLTLYGWALLTKCTISMLVPSIGIRSLAQASSGSKAFVSAGIALLVLAASCVLALAF